MKVRDALRILERDGWVILRQKGSHRQLKHPSKRGTVTVAGHRSDEIPPGTLNSVLRQAGPEVTEYAVIIERGDEGFGAYVPDLPGCVATGSTREEAERLISEAILLHVEELRKSGEAVPEPRTVTSAVDV